jgi:hypothetical protein
MTDAYYGGSYWGGSYWGSGYWGVIPLNIPYTERMILTVILNKTITLAPTITKTIQMTTYAELEDNS